MIEKYLRYYYQFIFVDPIARRTTYMSPSQITLVGCLFGIISGITLALGWVWTGFLCLLLSGYLDTLDGTLARLKNQSTPFGSALDIICDRFVELAIVMGLFLLHDEAGKVYALLVLGSILICVTSFLVVGIFTENTSQKSFHYSPGLIERGEAFLFFSLMIFTAKAFILLSIIFSFLTFLTAIFRIYQFAQYQQSSREKANNSRPTFEFE